MVLYKIDAIIKEKINALVEESFIKMSITLFFLSIVILIVQR